MEAGEHAEDRGTVDAGDEGDATRQGPVQSRQNRSHLQDQQTYAEDRVLEGGGGDYTAADPRRGFTGGVEGRR